MANDVIVKKSGIDKKGSFAARNFKKEEVVIKWKSPKKLTQAEVDHLPDSEKYYVSSYRPGEYILQQIPDRYVNHSCDPNTKVQGYSDVAIKDIKKDQEITSDYGTDNIQLHHFECHCGSKNCRKFI